MTIYDYSGWIWLTKVDGDTFKVRCSAQPELEMDDPSVTHIDYPADGHTAWSLDTRVRKVTIKGIWFTTTARYEAFMSFLDDAQGGTLQLKIKIQTTSPYYRDWDGNDKYTMPVKWKKPRGIKKLYGGDTTIWEIGQIVFRQSGALEA